MRDAVGISERPHTGMTSADLATERAELLPERVTLAVWEWGRQEYDPFNQPINSPGSNNYSVDGHAESQIGAGNGSLVQSGANNQSYVNQW